MLTIDPELDVVAVYVVCRRVRGGYHTYLLEAPLSCEHLIGERITLTDAFFDLHDVARLA